MRKKTIFLAGLTAALLLWWTGYLPAKGIYSSQMNRPVQNEYGNQGGSEDSGEDGDNSEFEDTPAPQPGEKTPTGLGDNYGDNGEGRGADGSSVKKVSYKDSTARAAKYTAQKKYASAAREYNRALTALSEDDRRKVFIYERQGWLALMENDISGAESLYMAAIYQAEKIEAYDKSAVNAYRGAAYCYEREGDISSAVENYQLALKHATDKGTKADIRKKLQRLQAGKRKNPR